MSPFKDFDLDIVKVTATSGISPRSDDHISEDCGASTVIMCATNGTCNTCVTDCDCVPSYEACETMDEC